MIAKIIRAPVNLFFDRVPVGRLLNRFSKDLAVIDSYISSDFDGTLAFIFAFFADLTVCIVFGSIYVLPLCVLFFIVAFYYQKQFMTVNREVYRLCKRTL